MDHGPRTHDSSRWLDLAWLVVLMSGAAWWCSSASDRLGPTYDERFYLWSGLNGWRDCYAWKLGFNGFPSDEPPPPEHAHWWWGTGRRLALNGVMPLPIDAATLPLFLHEIIDGHQIDDPLEYLRWARLVTLVWLGLLLISALRLGRALACPWAGRLAAGLIATDPNVLAHSTVATTDVCVAALLTAFARAVHAGRAGGWWGRMVLPGLWFGAAALAKLSALLYGGLILMGLEIAYRFSAGHLSRPPNTSLRIWAFQAIWVTVKSIAAASAVIVIGIGIAVAYCSVPQPGVNPMRLEFLEQVPYAVVTFDFQWWHNSLTVPTFVNGTYYPEGCWYFFPLTIAIKTPLPVLLLGIFVLLRPRGLLNPLVPVGALMLASALPSHLQLGYRLVLPVVAIGYVALAVALVRGWGRVGVWVGGAVLISLIGVSMWVWPHGLCYLNQMSGGLSAARRLVSDSNYDWGQGMPELAAWHKVHGEPPTVVWYFGTDPAADRAPFQQIRIEALPITSAEELRKAIGHRVLAVGATVATMHPNESPAKSLALEYLRTCQPIGETATFTLYDFREWR